MEFVSWDYYSQLNGKINMFQTTNQNTKHDLGLWAPWVLTILPAARTELLRQQYNDHRRAPNDGFLLVYWLVVSTPLKKISQIGSSSQLLGKQKHVPNHQPLNLVSVSTLRSSRPVYGKLPKHPAWPEHWDHGKCHAPRVMGYWKWLN